MGVRAAALSSVQGASCQRLGLAVSHCNVFKFVATTRPPGNQLILIYPALARLAKTPATRARTNMASYHMTWSQFIGSSQQSHPSSTLNTYPDHIGDSAQDGEMSQVCAWLDAGGAIDAKDGWGYTLLASCAFGKELEGQPGARRIIEEDRPDRRRAAPRPERRQ